MKRNLSVFFCGAALFVPAAILGQNIVNPAVELSNFSPAGKTEIALAATAPKMATAVTVSAKDKPTATVVERQNNAQSAVYAGVAKHSNVTQTQPTEALFAVPPDTSKYVFKINGDSGQAWATMNANGMPFLFANSFGKGSANATASLKAKVSIPAGMTKLYAQITIPKVSIQGATEQDAPASWQVKFASELLMNGHPVWDTEAIHFSLMNNIAFPPEKAAFDSFYGSPVYINNNDNNIANKVVTLALGTFTPGKDIELTFINRVDTSVLAACQLKPDASDNNIIKPFCTRATASLNWDNTNLPVRFFVAP